MQKKWMEAKRFCCSLGMSLVTIQNKKKQSCLAKRLSMLLRPQICSSDGGVFEFVFKVRYQLWKGRTFGRLGVIFSKNLTNFGGVASNSMTTWRIIWSGEIILWRQDMIAFTSAQKTQNWPLLLVAKRTIFYVRYSNLQLIKHHN
jgi:hypothetical protein